MREGRWKTPRRDQILADLAEGPLTVRRLAEMAQARENTMRCSLNRLRKRGVVAPVGFESFKVDIPAMGSGPVTNFRTLWALRETRA